MAPEVEVLTARPEIPSKWDIIPIHGSDIASYQRCRRYWDWTSPARNNLRRNVSIYGMSDSAIAMWFGSGCHYALESMYDPMLKRDPVEAFKTWFTFQWEGGVVGEEWLERTYDVHPRFRTECTCGIEPRGATKNGHKPNCPVVTHTWHIKGLKEILPNLELVEEKFEFHKELGIGMMGYYKEYSEKHDDFVVVAAESTYSIPLGFESVDIREDSPNYGKALEVHARGKRDAILWFPELNRFRVNEYKTAERVDEDYFLKLENDPQCTNYLWATIMEAKLFDLPWNGHMVDAVIYNVLRKRYPRPPTITTKDVPSIDRQNEGTTPELFQAAIEGNPYREAWFRENEKAQNYYTWLCEVGEENFITRKLVDRNAHEIKAFGERIRMVAEEMLDPNLRIYPTPSGNFQCLQCAFRAPCLAKDDGSDWKGMLADGYEYNRDR